MKFEQEAKRLLVAAHEVFPIAGPGAHTIALDPKSGGVTLMVLVEHTVGQKQVRQFWRLGIDENLDWHDLKKDLSDAKADVLRKIEAMETNQPILVNATAVETPPPAAPAP
jgi:hypothetical protein